MGIKRLLKLLNDIENGKLTTEEVVDLPCFRTAFEAMAKHPEATRTYMHERQTVRFQHRSDIGAHTARFAELIGLPEGQVSAATHQMGIHSRRTQESLDREQVVEDTIKDRVARLKAVVEVVQGYGSVLQVSEEYGIAHKVIYNHLDRHLAANNLDLKDLKGMSTPKRRALGDKVLRAGTAELEAYRKSRIKGDGEYGKSVDS